MTTIEISAGERFGSFFLVDPDRFPGPAEGEPYGDERLVIDLIGGPYTVSGLSAMQRDELAARFAGFIGEPAENGEGVAVRLLRCGSESFVRRERRGWVYTLDLAPTPSQLRVAGLGFAARLKWAVGAWGELWTCIEGGEELGGVVENCLRLLVAYRSLDLGGVLLHSAAVARDDRALVFVGRSGAGKTTISRSALAAGWAVLSDDMNVLRPGGDGTVVERLPFAGDLGRQATPGPTARVAGVYRLAKGAELSLQPLMPAAAAATLMACAPAVNVDPGREPRLAAVIEEIAGAVETGIVTTPRGVPFEAVARLLEET